jgi:hypothetical protein
MRYFVKISDTGVQCDGVHLLQNYVDRLSFLADRVLVFGDRLLGPDLIISILIV